MKLEFTPLSIAECEDKLIKLGISDSFIGMFDDQKKLMGTKNILLMVSAGCGGDIQKASDYIVEWCKENDKQFFEILVHLIEELKESRFLDLTKVKGLQGVQDLRDTQEEKLQKPSENSGKKEN